MYVVLIWKIHYVTDLLLPSTQFDMYSAENAGLIKFDILGLKTLTVLNKSSRIKWIRFTNPKSE